MPIGTSDGEHFDDPFHQAVSQYTPMPRPDPRPKETPFVDYGLFKNSDVGAMGSIEDQRKGQLEDPEKQTGQDLLSQSMGYYDSESRNSARYLYQDTSRSEKNPLSIQAGIKQIPTDLVSNVLTKHNRKVVMDREMGNVTDDNILASIPSNVHKILSDPKIQEAISNPKIDRSHDVPYEAGASNDPNDFTTHIDKRIPTSVSIDGKTFDPAIPANIHEQVEREVMERLIKAGHPEEKAYEIAHHEYAEPAEDAWYRQQGIDVNKVNEWWAQQDKITEHESPKNPPPNLYTKPYPHNKVEGVKHEPTNVYAEWPAKTPP